MFVCLDWPLTRNLPLACAKFKFNEPWAWEVLDYFLNARNRLPVRWTIVTTMTALDHSWTYLFTSWLEERRRTLNSLPASEVVSTVIISCLPFGHHCWDSVVDAFITCIVACLSVRVLQVSHHVDLHVLLQWLWRQFGCVLKPWVASDVPARLLQLTLLHFLWCTWMFMWAEMHAHFAQARPPAFPCLSTQGRFRLWAEWPNQHILHIEFAPPPPPPPPPPHTHTHTHNWLHRQYRYHAVSQPHNIGAETHLGFVVPLAAINCSSALFDFRCQCSSYERPTKILTTCSHDRCHSLALTCRNSPCWRICECCSKFLSSLWPPLLTWSTERGHHVACSLIRMRCNI